MAITTTELKKIPGILSVESKCRSSKIIHANGLVHLDEIPLDGGGVRYEMTLYTLHGEFVEMWRDLNEMKVLETLQQVAGPLKPYMAFFRHAGPAGGAALVVAHSVKEARPLAWRKSLMDIDEWTDLGVRLIRDPDILLLADPEKLAAGQPHVIDSPLHCQVCGLWGAGLTEDNLCCHCNEPPGEDLVRCLTKKRV